MDGVYVEENGIYQIDLRAALWSKGYLHTVYECIGNILSDVDFIAETDNTILLIEYKNTDIENTQNPEALDEKVSNGKLYDRIVNKYYGSVFYLMACARQKPIHYIFILESRLFMESKQRKKAEYSIIKRLPFELQKIPEVSRSLINDFRILSISEWNKEYPMFPLQPVCM